VSWSPARLDRDVAREVITFLEDRRVLYDPAGPDAGYASGAASISTGAQFSVTRRTFADVARTDEDLAVEYAVESVLEIRRFLGRVMSSGGLSDDLLTIIRGMQRACREFVSNVHSQSPALAVSAQQRELRGAFGPLIAELAVRYGIDVTEPLVHILPLEPPD
jgi:hypothetical protein